MQQRCVYILYTFRVSGGLSFPSHPSHFIISPNIPEGFTVRIHHNRFPIDTMSFDSFLFCYSAIRETYTYAHTQFVNIHATIIRHEHLKYTCDITLLMPCCYVAHLFWVNFIQEESVLIVLIELVKYSTLRNVLETCCLHRRDFSDINIILL